VPVSARNPSAPAQGGIGKMPGVHIRQTTTLPASPPKQEPAKESRMRKLLIALTLLPLKQ
jgi:hypothetical protein